MSDIYATTAHLQISKQEKEIKHLETRLAGAIRCDERRLEEIELLEAENARLREALEECERLAGTSGSDKIMDIARAALSVKCDGGENVSD